MPKQLQLNIPTPCHEGWENMTPVDKARPDGSVGRGRFCGSCQKQVVDFSVMNDRQMAEFFKKPSTGSVCGRFMTDQLDRTIDIPKKRIPWARYFFQVALPAFLVSIKSSAQTTKGKVKVVTTKSISKAPTPFLVGEIDITEPVACNKPPATDTTITPPKPMLRGMVMVKYQKVRSIKGIVTNENGEPLPGATVMIKGTNTGVAANADGTFDFRAKTAMETFIVRASYVGYEMLETNVDRNSPDSLVLTLKPIDNRYVEGFVVVARSPVRKEIRNVPLMSLLEDDAKTGFTVFPNPAVPGGKLSIRWKKLKEGDYTIGLFNQSGQPVYSHDLLIGEGPQQLDIEIPMLPGGSYFLVLESKKTGKRSTEKIIIQ